MRAILTACVAAFALAAPATAAPAQATGPEEAAAIATAQQFFDAMAAQDAATLREITLPATVFTAVRATADGGTQFSRVPLEDFLGNLRPGVREAMWTPRVSVRGGLLATISAPYEVQIDGKTLHCGIDVFSLVKVKGGWKIAGLMWTQEPAACPELKARK